MNPNQIKVFITNMGPATRDNREEKAAYFLTHPESLTELIKLCFDTNFSEHHKALWILEIVLEYNLDLLLPYLNEFISHLSLLKKDSAIRPAAKICRWFLKANAVNKEVLWVKGLTEKNLEQLVEVSFDWLIGPYKAAPKAYSMDSLLWLGYLKEEAYSWIHNELKQVILNNIYQETPAYQAHGKMILNELK